MGSPAQAVSFLTDLTSWHTDNFNPNTTETFDTTALHGLEITNTTVGRMTCNFPVNKRVQNRFGALHGGCVGNGCMQLNLASFVHEGHVLHTMLSEHRSTKGCELACLVKQGVPEHDVYVAATLVDDVSSGAVRSMSEHPGMSVHMSMNYFSPTPGGQDCKVDSRVTKVGRTLAFAEVHPSSYAACTVSQQILQHIERATG